MRRVMFAAVVAIGAGQVAPAFAFQCPSMMADIESKLAETEGLSEGQRAEIQRLLEEGGRLHEAGQHQRSVDTLAQAQKMLEEATQ